MLYEVIRWDANRLASRLLLKSWNNSFIFIDYFVPEIAFLMSCNQNVDIWKVRLILRILFFFLLWKGKCPHSTMSWTVSELSWCQTDRKDTWFSTGIGLCLVPFWKALNSAELFQISFSLPKYFSLNLIQSIAPTSFDRPCENGLYIHQFYLQFMLAYLSHHRVAGDECYHQVILISSSILQWSWLSEAKKNRCHFKKK